MRGTRPYCDVQYTPAELQCCWKLVMAVVCVFLARIPLPPVWDLSVYSSHLPRVLVHHIGHCSSYVWCVMR
jgi:hypothetical protein